MLRYTYALFALSATLFLTSPTSFAANIAASISGGTLFLYGDNLSSSITINSPSNGTIQITGEIDREGNQTTVNGQPSVQLNGWTRGINGYFLNGFDDVVIVEAIINGTVFIDLERNDDSLVIGAGLPTLAQNALASEVNRLIGQNVVPTAATVASDAVIINGNLVLIGGGGDDLIDITNTDVTGHVTIDSGANADEVYIGTGLKSGNYDVAIGAGLTIIPGDAPDVVELSGVSIKNTLVVDDVLGSLSYFLGDVSVGASAFFYGTSASDYIETDEFNVRYMLRFIMELGNDYVRADGSANHLVMIGGSNSDRLLVNDFSAKLIEVFMDQQDDRLNVDNVTANTFNAFGGAGDDHFVFNTAKISRANIYGDDGYDRYFSNQTTSIGDLKLYSIETSSNR